MRYNKYKRPHDKRWNKAWYFFMLVAAGLILSWGQVGQRYKQNKPVETREHLLLRTEEGCDLNTSPCAAMGPDYALVIKLQKNIGWHTVYIKAAGEPLTHDSLVSLSFEPESPNFQTENMPVRFKAPDTWVSFLQLPDNDKTRWKLRIKVDRGKSVFVADYPVPINAGE